MWWKSDLVRDHLDLCHRGLEGDVLAVRTRPIVEGMLALHVQREAGDADRDRGAGQHVRDLEAPVDPVDRGDRDAVEPRSLLADGPSSHGTDPWLRVPAGAVQDVSRPGRLRP